MTEHQKQPPHPKDRPWLMRTSAGHSSAEASNALYRRNLAKGRARPPAYLRHPHEARLKTATWIADFYNTRRRHSAAGGKPPVELDGSSRKREPGPVRKAGRITDVSTQPGD